jgi:lipoprotein-releasing system permease protein
VPGVQLAMPLVEGRSSPRAGQAGTGALVRGMRAEDLTRLPSVSGKHPHGRW